MLKVSGSISLGQFDDNKDESYLRRRNQLLNFMQRQRWDDDEEKISNRGRKPKIKIKPIQKERISKKDKFFKFN